MATAPVKSQPLHNFSLPFLKWGHKNQVNANHRCRRPSEATLEHHRSPTSEQDSDGCGSKNEPDSENRKLAVGSQRNRFAFASCSSQKQERERDDENGERGKEKVCDEEAVEAEELQAKPWNLRPRRATSVKALVEIDGVAKNGELQETAPSENLPKSMRLRGFVDGQTSEKKEKRKFWIALSREEIEEDVYAMTGARPARRPKKRTKTVQKQLDSVFPGLYLVGVTADAYRVHEVTK